MKYAPYSYSKMSTFKCKNKFKLQYVDKIKTPFNKSVAMEIGSFKHFGIEKYLEGSKTFKDDVLNYKFSLVDAEKQKQVFAELSRILKSNTIKFYKQQEKLEIEMGFGLVFDGDKVILGKYSKQSHIRGYIDLMYYDEFTKTAYIIDHKTGKTRQDQDPLQLHIYYLVAMLMYPEAEVIQTQFNFVDNDETVSHTFYPSDFEKIKKIVLDYIDEIENESEFEKSEHYCDYCPFMKSGHCKGIDNDIFAGQDEFKLPWE